MGTDPPRSTENFLLSPNSETVISTKKETTYWLCNLESNDTV